MPVEYNNTIRKIQTLYTLLNEDGHHKDKQYRRMLGNLEFLLHNSREEPEDKEAYKKIIDAASQYVDEYLNQKGHHFRHYHEERRARVLQLAESLDELRILTAPQQEEEHEMGQDPLNSQKAARKELNRLAALHAASSPKLVRPEPKYRTNPSLASRAWNGFKHVFMHGFRSFFFALDQFIAAPLRVVNWFADTTNIQDKKDFRRIPGLSSGEKFQQNDAGRLGNNLLNDSRRAPMVWETPVPEDPDQPPTMTIKSEQAMEGSARSSDRAGTGEVGHAFITLKYTKKDPITGENTRYQLSFGFHPKHVANQEGTQITMLVNEAVRGGLAPGELMDDANSDYHASRTWPVTTNQINKVLLAAEDFAKGGYNMITRNCTTFVKTMADAAGIDTQGLFQEVDFQVGATGKAGVGIGSVFGSVFKATGKIQLRNVSAKADTESYQLIGQDAVSKEDISHLHGEFNLRMKGYQPSRLAEMIKQQDDFVLGATNYTGKDEKEEAKLGENGKAPSDQKLLFSRINRERQNLFDTIQKFYTAHKLEGYDQFAEGFDRLTDQDFDQILSATSVLNAIDDNRFNERYVNDKMQITECVPVLDRLEKNLNDLFTGPLNQHPDLMLPFQHMVSVLENVRKVFYKTYNDLDTQLPGRVQDKEFDPALLQVDESREASFALRNLRTGSSKFYNSRASSNISRPLTTTAAGAIVCGNIDEYMNFLFEESALKDKQKNNSLTSEEEKRLDFLRFRSLQINTMDKALTYYAGADHFTQGEIDFLFRDLPIKCTDRQSEAYEALQAFGWEHVLSPFKDQVKAAADLAGKSVPAGNWEAKQYMRQTIPDMLSVLPEPLIRDQAELDRICLSVTSACEQAKPFAPENGRDIANYISEIREQSIERLFTSLKQSYILPMGKAIYETTLQGRETDICDNTVANLGVYLDLVKYQLLHEINPEKYSALLNEDYLTFSKGDDPAKVKEQMNALVGKIRPLMAAVDSSLTQTRALEGIVNYLEEERKPLTAGKSGTISEKAQAGADLVYREQQKAALELRNFSVSRKQAMSKAESHQEFNAMTRFAFARSLEKLPADKRAKILETIAAKPKAFDQYVESLSNNEKFLKALQKDGGISVNTLSDKDGFIKFVDKIDRALQPGKGKAAEADVKQAKAEPVKKQEDISARIQ